MRGDLCVQRGVKLGGSIRDHGVAERIRELGLADRVEALGGTLTVASPPGAGTRLEAELPIGEESAR